MPMLDAPIPGSSLTTEPGNNPWEQPPLYDTPEDALQNYLERFEDPEILEDMLFLFDQKFPVSVFVDSLTTSGVMEGLHTIDVSTLIAPILHEYVVALAAASGVEVLENDGPTDDEKMKAKEKKRLLIMLENLPGEDSDIIAKSLTEGMEADTPEDATEDSPPDMGLDEQLEGAPKGFINRKK